MFNQEETKAIALKAIETMLPDQKVVSVKINYDKELEVETEPKEVAIFVTDNPKPEDEVYRNDAQEPNFPEEEDTPLVVE